MVSPFGRSNSSVDEKSSDEKGRSTGVEVSVTQIDTAAALVDGNEEPEVSEQVALAVRRKIDWHILPLMATLYWIQYMDKATLGSAAIFEIREDAHLTTDQYNWLGTVFYLSYLALEFPQNLALQRFPVAKWLSFNIFVWGIALCAHAACKNFSGLVVVRLILGMCEGSITTGFLIVSSMFYTHKEQTLRVGYWFLTNGAAQIISGFISFGTLHIHTEHFAAWKWLMMITGALTFVTAGLFWSLFPDSPTTAWFLTPQERAIAVLRIKVNQTGVENKHFKKEQMIEALLDPKTWLFALLSALTNVPNSLSNQKSIIVSSFGFSRLQTTLLTCVDGIVEMVTIYVGVNVAARTNQRAYTAFCWKIPNIIGAILVNTLPWSNKIGLLFSFWITGVGTTAFIIALAWMSSVTAGHTKRVTTNAIMLSAYCIGNAVGPFMWKEQYKPRNHVPWIIICCCFVSCMALFLTIRYVLSTENKRRDALPPTDDPYDNVYVERLSADGVLEKVKVDKQFLDLTDRQNPDFRYVL